MDDGRRQSLTTVLFLMVIAGAFLVVDLVSGSGGGPAADLLGDTAEADAPGSGEASGGEPDEGPDADRAPTGGAGEATSRDGAAAPPAADRPEQTVTLVGEGFEAVVTNDHGGLRSVRLLREQFEGPDGEPEDVVTTDKGSYLPFQIELANVPIQGGTAWELDQVSSREARLRWEGQGLTVERTIAVGDGPYQLRSEVRVTNRGSRPRKTRLRVKTYHYVAREDEEGGFFGAPGPGQAQALCLWKDEVVRHERDDDEIEVYGDRFGGGMGWGPEVRFTGVANRYFANLLVAPGERVVRCRLAASDRGNPDPVGALFQTQLSYPEVTVPPGEEVTATTLGYFGPKDPEALAAAGHDLDRVVDLGFFAAIAGVLADLLALIHGWVGNWGVAIILLTVFIRTLLLPLTFQSFKSMARMRLLKPEMDRINELYADEAEKKGAAIMELYRKHKVNPVSGCLPQLLQLPVWWALYTSLSTNFELYHAPFLIWNDLSAADPYFVLPLSVGGLIFVQQKLTPVAMDPAQAKVMLYAMPVMITSFMLFLPAGLCVYIATNSVLGIAQQKWIERRLGRSGGASGEGASHDGASGQGDTSASAGGRPAGGNGAESPSPATAGSATGAPGSGQGSSTVRTRKPDRRRKRRGRA
jgi:YidC/Oxa1 family membrane protein insertase